jgi:hypothetical protein
MAFGRQNNGLLPPPYSLQAASVKTPPSIVDVKMTEKQRTSSKKDLHYKKAPGANPSP